MRHLIYISLLLISSCGFTPKQNQDLPIPTVHKVRIEKILLTPCKSIPELKGNTELDLVTWISEWKLIYIECKLGKDALITSIRAAFPTDSK